jgi:hypothetical protein
MLIVIIPSHHDSKNLSSFQKVHVGRREAKGAEAAPNKLGESNQANIRRQPPIQRHQLPKPFSRSQASMEPCFEKTYLEKKSDLEEVLPRPENKMPGPSSNRGKRFTYIHFLSKIIAALQASPLLDSREHGEN